MRSLHQWSDKARPQIDDQEGLRADNGIGQCLNKLYARRINLMQIFDDYDRTGILLA